MGAWLYLQPRLAKLIEGRWPLFYLGRPPNASPAEGSSTWHAANQQLLVVQAYSLKESIVKESGILWEGS